MKIDFEETKQKKIVVSGFVSIELFEKLEKLAKKNNTTKSKIITKILENYLKTN